MFNFVITTVKNIYFLCVCYNGVRTLTHPLCKLNHCHPYVSAISDVEQGTNMMHWTINWDTTTLQYENKICFRCSKTNNAFVRVGGLSILPFLFVYHGVKLVQTDMAVVRCVVPRFKAMLPTWRMKSAFGSAWWLKLRFLCKYIFYFLICRCSKSNDLHELQYYHCYSWILFHIILHILACWDVT
jgi:hypothetical protein